MRKFIKLMFRFYYKIMFGVKVHGLEKLPDRDAYLICSNHLDARDPFVIGSALDPEISILAKKELFKNKIVAWFISLNGAIPVDREANDISAIKGALKILKGGNVMMLFPEGTRNKTKVPLEAKPGVAMIAVKAKVPIVPISFIAEYKHFKKMHVVIHDPIYLDEYFDQRMTTEKYQEISQNILDKIYEGVNDENYNS
ncbi:1-acyl-sn-glycerol-3-phosphate acyltransferase [Acidaminobacter sp. JC074]|uniref:lysophospholipid acyltransferase family protein n=1 Tax=Acidaminobacter sp. JC074 TaxID=2530199 RepID=UPI001F0F5B85|nr:lysophospholipid acyltransferase family protein [Acidaminobacter sp. JC074]MCH4888849.1 1-acyl-sn-glycerol-3-phosphate acyltransferase [Acidaminobacter sp. JC074]